MIRVTQGTRVVPGRGRQHRVVLMARTSSGPRAWSVPWGLVRGQPRRLPVWVLRHTPHRLWPWLPY